MLNTHAAFYPQGIFNGVFKYHESAPGERFKNLIAFYCQYSFKDNAIKKPYTVLPDGCVDIKFYCHPNKPLIQACGTRKRNALSNFPCDAYDVFTVRFWPGQFYRIFPLHATDLTDNVIDIQNQISLKFREIIKLIDHSMSFTDRIKIVEGVLLESLHGLSEIPKWLESMISQIIHCQGRIEDKKLFEKFGFSDRYIRREFTKVVGITPKHFGRIIKMQNALLDIQANRSLSIVDVALKYGFYDQAHFSHRFKEFYGSSPTNVLPHLFRRDNTSSR